MSDPKSKSTREFGLSNFAINNSTSVFVLIFIILLAGIFSYTTMPKESFPEIVQPTIYVGTGYPGNSPVDMENLVTRPIEKELKQLKGVKNMTSTSIQDYSTIVVEFEYDTKTEEALTDVKDAVDKSKSDLPNDLPADPNVFEIDFSEFPVMNVNLFGDFGNDELEEYAEYLQEKIEELGEVSSADIRGLVDKEVEISVDLYKMESLEISFTDIENAITGENVTMSGGDILSIQGDSERRRSLRIIGEFDNYRQIEDIIVKNENQEIVYLRDIASVRFGPEEPSSFARLNGQNVVTLDVKKKSGENLLNAAASIRDIIAEAQEDYLPAGLDVVITNDQSKFTQNTVTNLENSIISGVILVVLVLLFFLGVRNAMIVGTAIPLSMLLGIAIINYTGNTLNMMVLFSLILALGLLVDNGIVVVENIYRLYTQGKSRITASRQGVGEVALPIISSTATTLMAFLPLVFWKSLIGEFMKFLPITLIIVLTSSLFVGLVVNPVLTSKFLKLENLDKRNTSKRFWGTVIGMILIGGIMAFFLTGGGRMLGSLLFIFGILGIINEFAFKPASKVFQEKVLVWMESIYSKTLRFALRGWMPGLFFGGTFVLLIASLMIFSNNAPKTTFFPDNQPNYVNVFIEMPLGTDIERTDEITRQLEQKVTAAIEPYSPIVESVLAQVGEGTADPNSGPQQGSSPHKARITVSFYEYEKRIDSMDASTSEVMEVIRESVTGIPEVASLSVGKDAAGPPTGPPINIEISGEDYDKLIVLTNEVKEYLESAEIPGVDQLKTDLELGKPELIVHIDRDAARRYGVSTYSIASTVRTALFGKEVSKYKEGEDDYPIQLRLEDDQRYDLSTLLNMRITFRNQATGRISQVPVSAVVDIENSSSFGSVKRKDMDRVITIFSNVTEEGNANEIVAKYKALLADYELPEGYTLKFTGEQEEQNDSLAFLMQAMVIAVFLIFLIIVSQFNSVISPVIILFSVVFSTIGVFIGFTVFQMDMSILMVGIGIISLAGIVVNNAIVLIDYTNLLRKRHREEAGMDDGELLPFKEMVESIVEAGKTRFRPVILTAVTTILGLVPLALGINIDFYGLLAEFDPNIYMGGDSAIFWGPMSWTIIFGLTFATFLTLVIVPVMYLLSDRLNRWVRKLFGTL